MNTNITDRARNYEWLWRGSLDDVKNGMKAFLIAPIFALVPVIPMLTLSLYRGTTLLTGALAFCAFTLLFSYGITLIIGLPWYYILAWRNRAGLLPVMAASSVPFAWVFIQSLSRHDGRSFFAYMLFTSAGLAVSGAYWKIARHEKHRAP